MFVSARDVERLANLRSRWWRYYLVELMRVVRAEVLPRSN